MQASRKDIVQRFISIIPHSQDLGLEVANVDDEGVEILMPFDPSLVGDPTTGVLSGGVITTLMDTCGGAAVVTHEATPLNTATLDLRIDYMRAATPGQAILARAECYHTTHHVAFVRVHAWDDNRELPVAIANAAFTIDRGKKLV